MKPEQMRVHKTAMAIFLTGLVFSFFTAPAFGIDLLLDPVGFLLIFNAMNTLRKLAGGNVGAGYFKVAMFISIALILLSTVPIFFDGEVGQAALTLRPALETVLFAMLLLGYASPALQLDLAKTSKICFMCAIFIAELAAIFRGVTIALDNLGVLIGSAPVAQAVSKMVHILLLLVMLVVFRLYKREEKN
jgi:hypothetical protein